MEALFKIVSEEKLVTKDVYIQQLDKFRAEYQALRIDQLDAQLKGQYLSLRKLLKGVKPKEFAKFFASLSGDKKKEVVEAICRARAIDLCLKHARKEREADATAWATVEALANP